MICFQIEINGKTLCTAGIGEFGVLTTVLSWVNSSPQTLSDTENIGGPQLKIGGIRNVTDRLEENVEWASRSLGIGDEIRITITDSVVPDDPNEVTTRNRARELEETKEHYRWLIAEMEKDVEP